MVVPGLYMLDTNTLSYLISGRSAQVRVQQVQHEMHAEVVLSVMTEAELLAGLRRLPPGARIIHATESALAKLKVLPWNSAAAQAYARLKSELARAGKVLSSMDLLIAAHAIALDAVLVTHDQAFRFAAPLLRTEDWATDL